MTSKKFEIEFLDGNERTDDEIWEIFEKSNVDKSELMVKEIEEE